MNIENEEFNKYLDIEIKKTKKNIIFYKHELLERTNKESRMRKQDNQLLHMEKWKLNAFEDSKRYFNNYCIKKW